jgi:hypothetical protein
MAVATNGIRALTVVAAVALSAIGCASGGGSGSAPSCAATLRLHHHLFIGTSLRTHPPRSHLHQIGVAVQPPCLDTNHPGANDTPIPVQVARIEGVSPKIAVAALPTGNVYLLRGARIPRILRTARWVR